MLQPEKTRYCTAEQTIVVGPMTLETQRQQLRDKTMPCETAESSCGGAQSFNVSSQN